MSAIRNDVWQGDVHALLRQGYGAEDIAIKLNCRADDVRREVQILRETHQLARVLGKRDTTK